MSDSNEQPKKPKLEEPGIKTCAHWLQRKKRYCKMTVAKGRDHCGEHLPSAVQADGETAATDDARIPCPLDSKHTVYRKNLKKHLKICNARPSDNVPPYIQKGINAGSANDDAAADYRDLKLGELDENELLQIVEVVRDIHAKYIEDKIGSSTARHDSLNDELTKSEYGKETRKHLLQTAALLGVLDEKHLLQDATSFIEFGAGKGQLAFYLAKILKDYKSSQVILLDRMSLRHKKDNKIEDRELVHRIRVDIADFSMQHLDLLRESKHIVAVSKHLCGAATDLTLRCITQDMDRTSTEAKRHTDFIMIALCCHHRCDWRTFVGKDFLHTQGITPRQFVIITKMVGWAICGTGMSRERRRELENQSTDVTNTKNNIQRFTIAERERIGFICKRILDYGRLEYLRQQGYDACLKYYVPNDVTLENVCLLARRIVQG